uniref:Uncharacterized protein n=1 Tax=Chlamydomonas euryale TaxID=1486919 RepID=A0A7R9YWX3_9CHLO|mmetsp:Transcript_33112/g.98486  ORF Transcript_33112/g.98486 Transcript_33112/m.98486 type:complete len:214 (+) Transcript_33112:93-734(+)
MDGSFPSQQGGAFDSPGGYGGGGGGRGRGRAGFRGTAENSKTKMCTRWLDGDCRFGDRCNFAHGEHELRQLPPRGAFGGGGGVGVGRGGGRGGYGERVGYGGYGGPQMGYGQAGGYGMEQAGMGGMGGYGMEQAGMGGMGAMGGMGIMGGMGGMGAMGGMGGSMDDPAWAAQGYPVQGPNGWTRYRDKDTQEFYYHNSMTNMTVWDRPPEWRI